MQWSFRGDNDLAEMAVRKFAVVDTTVLGLDGLNAASDHDGDTEAHRLCGEARNGAALKRSHCRVKTRKYTMGSPSLQPIMRFVIFVCVAINEAKNGPGPDVAKLVIGTIKIFLLSTI